MANCAVEINLVEIVGDDDLVGPVAGADVEIQPNRAKNYGTDQILTGNTLEKDFVNGTLNVVLPPDDAETATRFKFDGFAGSYELSGWYQIPDEVSVNFRDLVKVDPPTFDPLPGPAPAWAAPLAELEEALETEAETARNASNLTSGEIPEARIPATITRDTELAAAVAAAVDALVAGAPGALNTLAELADAIGDDADFAGTLTSLIATKASTTDLNAAAAVLAAADDVLTAAIAAINNELDTWLPGTELGYAERTTTATTTATTTGNAVDISGLSVTVVGKGRPVDVEFYCPSVTHSVASTVVNALLVTNADTASTKNQFGSAASPSTVAGLGRPLYMKRRVVLDDGVSYTFTVRPFASAGTSSLYAAPTSPMFLSVVAR